tara:strand:- start:23069 stop:23242 length:174 start_codon:yes stop_codon:yes gene_type:complete
MSDIKIPFKVNAQGYTNVEIKSKDAITLEVLQRIANSLEIIASKPVPECYCNDKKGK